MEHLCHQCNTPVEDGVPFCPKCGAPQIRVVTEDNDPVTPPMPPGTPGEIQPPARPVYGAAATWTPATLDPNRVQWRAALPLAALIGLGAGVIFVLSGRIPFLFLIIPVLSGMLMARSYRARTHATLPPFAGAKVGAFAGLFSFGVSFLGVLAMFTLGRETIQQNMREAMANSPRAIDPQSAQMMQNLIDKLNTPEGMVLFAVVLLIILFGILFVGSAVGGALGAAMFGKDRSTS